MSWLNWFVDHAGIAERIIEPKAPSTDYTPDKHDLVVLLLLYAGGGMNLQALSEHNAVKLMFDVNSLDIVKRGEMLRQHDFIDDAGITALVKHAYKPRNIGLMPHYLASSYTQERYKHE